MDKEYWLYIPVEGIVKPGGGPIGLYDDSKEPIAKQRIEETFYFEDPTKKKCPQCAESIMKEAKICRFCGLELE